MGRLTTDRNDPDITSGVDDTPRDQAKAYLIEDLPGKDYVRPLRKSYTHNVCGTETTMSHDLAATYAVNPKFYGATYCVSCRMHKPVSEFKWLDGDIVGS